MPRQGIRGDLRLIASKKPFTDLGFRGTTWYLAEEVDHKLESVKIAFESHRDNIIELSGKLNTIAHELPEEYHFAIERIATDMISFGELRKILEAEAHSEA